MLSYGVEQGVLVITVDGDPGRDDRPVLAQAISDLVRAHRPTPVVIVLDEPAPGDAAVGVALQAHRLCGPLGVLVSVATHSAAARRILEAEADTDCTRLVVHARVDTAIAATFAAAM
ncbi:hypothetical protein GCM10014715_13990 [Streptomyces spiralis]|uniref:Uncharacterized protein n=1 Tax=Streptomyces spiralis TaxID=66376 RepID=A0A918ZMV2_9ACTN|nr:hypothetical protein [Streptomyces spiralis]GHE61706.1 hypothetical protein GCM10014715_13990 [Streptomyces spiralis]